MVIKTILGKKIIHSCDEWWKKINTIGMYYNSIYISNSYEYSYNTYIL